MSPGDCVYCGAGDSPGRTFEPELVRRTARGQVVVQPARKAPCCDRCWRDLGRVNPGMARAIRAARTRLWDKRQDTLW